MRKVNRSRMHQQRQNFEDLLRYVSVDSLGSELMLEGAPGTGLFWRLAYLFHHSVERRSKGLAVVLIALHSGSH